MPDEYSQSDEYADTNGDPAVNQEPTETTSPVDETPAEEQENQQEESLLLGKFRNPEEMAQSYVELEKKLGQQGQEVGTLKQMNELMLKQMQHINAREKTPPTQDEAEKKAVDYEGQLKSMSEAVESGDLSIGEAIIRASNLATERATKQALQEYESLTQKQTAEKSAQSFFQNNSDFNELRQNGSLDKIKAEMPGFHDDVSAYLTLKLQMANEALAAKEETKRIAQGAARTEKVIQKPAPKAPPSAEPKKQTGKLSDYEVKQAMLKRISA